MAKHEEGKALDIACHEFNVRVQKPDMLINAKLIFGALDSLFGIVVVMMDVDNTNSKHTGETML